jgi:hypothetical protein
MRFVLFTNGLDAYSVEMENKQKGLSARTILYVSSYMHIRYRDFFMCFSYLALSFKLYIAVLCAFRVVY